MNQLHTKQNELIERDLHCPYCGKDHAVLFSRTVSRKLSYQYPAYGLKFVLSLIYLSVLHILVYGLKFFEFVTEYNDITYVFCPDCGQSYSMNPPEVVKEQTEAPKFYRIKNGKTIMGVCRGISEYTGISLAWIHILTVLYGLLGIGVIVYLAIGICTEYKEDVEAAQMLNMNAPQ